MQKESLLICSKYDESIQRLAEALDTLLVSSLKSIQEFPDPKANMVAYGYANTYKDMICTMIFSKTEIKLGFYKGSALPDPEKLLTGAGKVHRYVAIKNLTDVKNKALKKLLGEALKAWNVRSK
ncbi:MAG TPA: DUF1801 domain-containing protein [Flavobacteriales bacterium]|nr:DUF1801 domain-containing protein [Flavobacteriales bacterium]